MNDTLLASLISAASGLLVVLVGQVVVPPIRERLSRRRDARYLAIRVVCVLDRYVEDCASTAIDSGIEDDKGYSVSEVEAPPPPAYPSDINWKSIDHSMMYKLLALPAAADRAANYIAGASEHASAPDFPEFYEARSRQYSLLGLKAHDLARQLRELYQIPEIENREWDPVSHMKEQLQELEDLQKRRAIPWEPPTTKTPERPNNI